MSTSSTDSRTAPRTAAPEATPALPAGAADRGPLVERARHGVAEKLRDLRFVADQPPCLLEHLAYARRGGWTLELDGPRRHAAVAYAWLVAIPLSIAAYLLAWCAARPTRLATALALCIAVASAAARVPVIGAVLPGWSHW